MALPEGHWAMTQGARRAITVVLLLAIAFAAVTLFYTARTTSRLRAEVQSQCRFDADLSGLPVTVSPATRTASVLGVKIISDSRVAWRLAGCPGVLAPASRSFTRWARYYHLPTG